MLDHLREVAKFIREYPIHPTKMLVDPGRGLSIGEGPIEDRANPWSVYQTLANHIDDYIKELVVSPTREARQWTRLNARR